METTGRVINKGVGEQEENHRNGDHREGYQQGSGRGREWGKVQRISSINGR